MNILFHLFILSNLVIIFLIGFFNSFHDFFYSILPLNILFDLDLHFFIPIFIHFIIYSIF
jgi:hypothetical protein